MRILIAIVVLAVLAFLGYRIYESDQAKTALQQAADKATATAQQAAQQAEQAATQAKQAAGTAVQAAGDAAQQAASLVVGGVDLGAEFKSVVEKASAALAGITDQASAQAALPSLDELKGKVDGLAAQVDALPTAGKTALATFISGALPTLKELAAKVATVPGADALKPALDAILAKLETWSKAPA